MCQSRQDQTKNKNLGGLGCATKWRLPSEMKGVHPEEDRVKQVARSPAWHREEPSRSGTIMLQECKPGAANLRAVARSEPRSSLVTRSREAEPLQARRRQHAVGKVLDGSPPRRSEERRVGEECRSRW